MQFLNQLMGWFLRTSYEIINKIIPGDSNIVSNYALAIILLTLILKLITLPLTLKSSKSNAKQRAIQPKLKEIQDKYGNDTLTIQRKVQELYKEEGVNPAGGCLPLLIQFPILIAMYNVVKSPHLYAFTEPGVYEAMQKAFFWIPDLNQVDETLIIAILAALTSYISQKLAMKNTMTSTGDKEQDAAMRQSNEIMALIMPIMFFFIYRSLPAVIPFYITLSIIFSTIQQQIINNMLMKKMEDKEAEKK